MGSTPLQNLVKKVLSRRFLTFGAVGFSGVFVNLGALYVLADRLEIRDLYASATAIEISIIWNFLLNNSLTFRDKNAGATAGFGLRMFRYNLVSLAGLGIQVGAFYVVGRALQNALHLEELGAWKYVAQLSGIIPGMAWNFFTNFFWTWRQRPERSRALAEGDSA